MKLAEALLTRSEMQNQLDNLEQLVTANLKVQEGDQPGEDPESLLAEAMRVNEEFCALTVRINRTNAVATLPDGRLLADALAEREKRRRQRHFLNNIALSTHSRDFRVTRSEIKTVLTLDVAALQKQIDATSKALRLLEIAIQGANWTIDLM